MSEPSTSKPGDLTAEGRQGVSPGIVKYVSEAVIHSYGEQGKAVAAGGPRLLPRGGSAVSPPPSEPKKK